MIHESQRYIIPDHVLIQEVGEEAVILNLENGRYYGLNEVGARFLILLREHGSTEVALETLREEFDVSGERLAEDIGGLLEALEGHGLVQRHPA